MKKIFNWVFGSFFRTLGRYLFYILMGFGLAIILPILIEKFDISLPENLLNSLILDVRAKEIDYTYSTYRIQTSGSSGSSWLPVTDFGSSTSVSIQEKNVTAMSVRFGRSSKFKKDVAYVVMVDTIISPNQDYNYFTNISNTTCFGSSSLSSWSANATYVSECSLRQVVKPTTGNHIQFIYYIKLNTDLVGFQFNTYFNNNPLGVSSFNVTSSSSVSDSESDIESSINALNHSIQSQTIEINNNINNNFNELENKLLDDELDDDEIQNVFDELEIEETSLNGFSNFLMVPLHWAETFLRPDQVCQPLQIPLPYLQNKNLTLPCMNDFWSRMGTLAALVDLVWLAVIGVRIFNGLFVLTIDVLSPKDNDDDLTKIKSWEL